MKRLLPFLRYLEFLMSAILAAVLVAAFGSIGMGVYIEYLCAHFPHFNLSYDALMATMGIMFLTIPVMLLHELFSELANGIEFPKTPFSCVPNVRLEMASPLSRFPLLAAQPGHTAYPMNTLDPTTTESKIPLG